MVYLCLATNVMILFSTLKKEGKKEDSHFYPDISKHGLASIIEI